MAAPTKRIVNNGFFALTEVVKPLIIKLFEDYSLYDVPLDLGD